jgi:SSS family transporter
MLPKGQFTWLDWAVVTITLLGMLAIGYHSAKGNKTQKDYILGGRVLNSNLVGFSLFATLFSTLSYLSYPGEMIKYGPLFCAGLLSFPVAYWVVGKFLIPKFVSMNVTSAYEILEIKLGKGSRGLASIFFLSLRYLWMSTIIYATVDIALVPILGLDERIVPLMSIILVLITVLYTSMGGLKAVVLTDFMQSMIMFLGVVLTIGIIAFKVGDLHEFLNPSYRAHWLKWDFMPRIHFRMTAFNIFIMNGMWQIMTAGSDQMAIQRYLSVRDVKAAKHSYAVSLTSSGVIQLLLALVGFMVLVFFSKYPEYLGEASIAENADQLFPLFITVGLPSGITGIIAAALIAAAMSSLSGGLNSCSAVIQEDILKKMKKFKNKEFGLSSIKKISAVLGIIVALSCFLIGYVQGNLLDVVIKVVNLVVAPLFVLFFMALFVPSATDAGTVIGGLAAFAVAILIAFFGIFDITAIWTMPFSFLSGALVGYICSKVERVAKNKNDEKNL